MRRKMVSLEHHDGSTTTTTTTQESKAVQASNGNGTSSHRRHSSSVPKLVALLGILLLCSLLENLRLRSIIMKCSIDSQKQLIMSSSISSSSSYRNRHITGRDAASLSSFLKTSKTLKKASNRFQSKKKQRSNNKPWLILHVGPPKTATTTLQTVLTNNRRLLEQDGYVYAGKYEGPSRKHVGPSVMKQALSYECHKEMSDLLESYRMQEEEEEREQNDDQSNNENKKGFQPILPEPKCWKKFRLQLQDWRSQGTNVIFSEEIVSLLFSRYPLRDRIYRRRGHVGLEFLKEFFDDDWNVRIVLGYRRYYEWLASMKHQADRLSSNQTSIKNKWPRDGGPDRLPLFPQLQIWKRTSRCPYPYTDQVLESFEQHFENTTLININDKEDMAVTFACQVLPDAYRTCSKVSKKIEPVVKNPSQSLFYDLLAVEANKREMVDPTLSRRQVVDAIRRHHEDTLGLQPLDLPLECPPKHLLEPLLNKSLEYERQLVPDFFYASGQEEHRQRFWKDHEKLKFCSVDRDAVLGDEAWIGFLKSLGPSS